MQNEQEKLLFERCGRKETFRVPDGYFEEFPQKVMQRINSTNKKRIIFRWMTAAAAMITFVSAITFSLMQTETNAPQQATAEGFYQDELDELDYSMLSNMDIALYLTEAEVE